MVGNRAVGNRDASFDHYDFWQATPRETALAFLWTGNTRFLVSFPPPLRPPTGEGIGVADQEFDWDAPSPSSHGGHLDQGDEGILPSDQDGHSEVDFFDEPHDELEIENTGSAPDHGNHSSTSSPALQIFIGTPSGTKFSVEIGDDLEIGFMIQSKWGDFNPKLHKIHKGCTRICPQETFGSYGLQRHDLISITTRSTGGAKTGDLTAKIAKTISGKDLPWDRAIANVEAMLQQAAARWGHGKCG